MNETALMNGKFSFHPKIILNKTLVSGTSKVNEEEIMDTIIQALPTKQDDFYIEHLVGSNLFTLKREDARFLRMVKNMFTSLKTDPNSVLFSEEKINVSLLKK